MSNELIFSIECKSNETVAGIKCKLANISRVLNNAVTFDVMHVYNMHIIDGVSTIVYVRMTYPDSQQQVIDELNDRLTAVEKESAEHRENIEELDSQGVFGYADEIDGISKRLDDLEAVQDVTYGYSDDVINCIGTINTRLDNLSKSIDTMRINSYRDYKALEDVKEEVSKLSELKKTIVTMKTIIDYDYKTLGILEESLDNNTKIIADLAENNIKNRKLDDRLGKAIYEIKDIKDRLSEVEVDQSSVARNVHNLKEEVTNLSDVFGEEISKFGKELEKLTTRIDILENKSKKGIKDV